MIRGIQHVGLNVRDVDEAVRFYTEALGCTVDTTRPDFNFPGAWLWVGNGQQIHVFGAEAPTPDPRQHVALDVEDLDALCARLDANGVRYRRLEPIPGAGQQAFLADPSGNRIELNQR